MFNGHPKGLWALALANTGERFGYYTMLAVFALFLRENFGLDSGFAGAIYSTFLGLVYFMPLVGGFMADKFGFGKMVTIGILVMFLGYVMLSLPLGGDTFAMIVMIGSLLFISLGTGLFKGNLQVMVGNLYDDPKFSEKRDSGFSLFYMAINIGALFAPSAAMGIKKYAENSLGYSSNDAYHFSFAVACAALIVSIIIYKAFRSTFRHVEGGAKTNNDKVTNAEVEQLSASETKQRVIALCLVFAVVIFFWMAFHQNGLTFTYFADEFVTPTSSGIESMPFNVWNLVLVIIAVYASFSIFQSKTAKAKLVSGVVATVMLALLVYFASNVGNNEIGVDAPIFQHFNPFYVVALTPVSMAIFSALAAKGKEPSAPRKIAYGMLVAAVGFLIMVFGSEGLNTPDEQKKAITVRDADEYARMEIALKAYGAENAALDTVAMKSVQDEAEKCCAELTFKNKELFSKCNSEMVAKYEKLATDKKELYAAAQKIYYSGVGGDSTSLVEYKKLVNAENKNILAGFDKKMKEYKDKLSEDDKVLFDKVFNATIENVNADNKKYNAASEFDAKPLTFTSPYWLILTYLILTFAELLLSPMGISFVSKVAPPKLKGMMMGGWFVATAIGNMLVSVGGFLWAGIPLTYVWLVFIVLCLLSALFMFVMMKRLEKVAK